MVVCGDGAAAYTTLNQVYADFHKSASDPDFPFHTWVNNNDIVPRLFGMQNKNLPAGRLKASPILLDRPAPMIHQLMLSYLACSGLHLPHSGRYSTS